MRQFIRLTWPLTILFQATRCVKKITKVVLPSGCCFGSACCKTDVNAQGWSETSFDDESNKEAIIEKIDKNYIQTLLAQVQQSNHY